MPEHDRFAPGLWRCCECDFRLQTSVINVAAGVVGANMKRPEPCPNDNTAMVRVTWKECAENNAEAADEQAERAHNAERRLMLCRVKALEEAKTALASLPARDDGSTVKQIAQCIHTIHALMSPEESEHRLTKADAQFAANFALAQGRPTEEDIDFAHGVGRMLEMERENLPATVTAKNGRDEWALLVATTYAGRGEGTHSTSPQESPPESGAALAGGVFGDADRETMRKVEALLALMHFNCGHSHSLGMHFDGDGPTHLEVVDAEFTEGPNEHYRLASRKVGEYAGRPISMVMATGDDDIPFVVYNGTLERPRRIGVFGELVKDNG